MKFAHVNIIAKDWKKLAQFYSDVFGCEPVYPERNLKGDWVDQLTGIKNAHFQGIHLKLPGNADGPTLEIFQFSPAELRTNAHRINQQGFGHLAFQVNNIEKLLGRIIEAGGKKYGELVKNEIPDIGTLTAVYMKDIEGNIIELQKWK